MIKFNIDRESEDSSCEIKGTTMELCMETIFMIRQIYVGIKEKDEYAASRFKRTVVELIDTAFLTPEELDARNKKTKEENEKLLKELDGALDALKDALKMRFQNNEETEEKKEKNLYNMDPEEFRKWLSEGDNE